jgi:hypothetical protein
VEANEPEYGILLSLLSYLERQGYEADARVLRKRVQAAVRELTLDEVRQELAAARRAAEALGRRA